MQNDIEDFIASLSDAGTSNALGDRFAKEIKALGYDGYDASSYAVYPERAPGGVPNFLVASYSPKFLETYLKDGYAEMCPVLTEIMETAVPFDYVKFLEQTEQNSSVVWQRRMLKFQRVAAAWCVPMNAVGAMRSVTVYMRDKGMRTKDRFEDTREDVAIRARHFMQALLAFQVGSGLKQNTIKVGRDLLSSREHDCLRFLVQGKSNPEIAEQMSVSRNTVHFHLKNVYRKMNVSNRTEAVRIAAAWGLVQLA